MKGKDHAIKIIRPKETGSSSSSQQNPKLPKRPEPNTSSAQKSSDGGTGKDSSEG